MMNKQIGVKMSGDMQHAVFTSYGNDSVALLQHLANEGTKGVYCVFSDTGWAHPSWMERVERGEAWAKSLGFVPLRLPSIGMKALVRKRKGWPMNGKQFCTSELKILPAMSWLESVDPDGELVCAVGIRREESRARSQWPEWTEDSDKHGGRSLWSPLVRHTAAMRDELCNQAGFEVLPHRSLECYPCINSNRPDLRLLATDEDRIAEIENFETELGFTSKGKPRTMFRPYRHQKAVGIREVVKWAMSERGKYEPPRGGCDSGFCGM